MCNIYIHIYLYLKEGKIANRLKIYLIQLKSVKKTWYLLPFYFLNKMFSNISRQKYTKIFL